MISSETRNNKALAASLGSLVLIVLLSGLTSYSTLSTAILFSGGIAWTTSWHDDYRIPIVVLAILYVFHTVTATAPVGTLLPTATLAAFLYFGRQNLSLQHQATPALFAVLWLLFRGVLEQMVQATAPQSQTIHLGWEYLLIVCILTILWHNLIVRSTRPLIQFAH
jgi:hypothetical protein